MKRGTGGRFVFNGIDARTGRYLFPALSAAEISRLLPMPKGRERALGPGIDPRDLAVTGWGVIFHERESGEIREALAPLLDHRKAQASRNYNHLYQELTGTDGYRDGEGKEDFLAKHRAVTGAVNPDRMPYYLLLVGGPDRIPFHFQQQLDVQYGVGRIAFDTPEEYARYAKSVVDAETVGAPRNQRVAVFGVRNPGDDSTDLTAEYLAQPLGDRLRTPASWQKVRDWEVQPFLAEEATKARLGRLFAGEGNPALLFTASHGLGFSHGDPLQREHQGALLCQDWPGPERWLDGIPPDFYFSGDDVKSDARVHGLIAFHFACHSAGTPEKDEFAICTGEPPAALTPTPFVGRLPQRLLAHPAGGALAVIGHVERAWAYSFLGQQSLSQLEDFEWALRMLMDGYPVGAAMEWFNVRYGELATDLALALQRRASGEKLSEEEIAGLWMANNNARNYAVMGDPAVRVKVG
jgi:Peptidase family C25